MSRIPDSGSRIEPLEKVLARRKKPVRELGRGTPSTVTHVISPGHMIALRDGGKIRLESMGKRKTLLFDDELETYLVLVALPDKKTKRVKTAPYERWAERISESLDDDELKQFHAMLDGDSRDTFFHFIGRELRKRRNPRN